MLNEELNKNAQEARKIVWDTANGSDTMVGGGIMLHGISQCKESNIAPPRWKGGGIDHTHQFLVARGILILENDKTWNVARHLYENNGATTLMEYADKPDEDEIGALFAGHFYNPYTGVNFLGQTSPTAKTNFLQHTEIAVNNFHTNRTYAWQELGRALHYIADMNQPHHASNMVAILTNHAEFELWVDQRRIKYGVTSSSKYNDYLEDSFETYCSKIADDSAKNAYAYKDAALASFSLFKYYNYDFAAKNTLPYTQQVIAAFLYRFLKAV
ncbi:MAG TPA: phospholipase [Clostridiaceae bacterium]|nr:phospholipase [Clostridiaceae bacterium]